MPTVPEFQCTLKNNTNRTVRVLIRSWFGEGDYVMSPGEEWLTTFKKGFKSLIAFDVQTQEPLGWYFMDVTKVTQFKVHMKYDYAAAKWVDPYMTGSAPVSGVVGVQYSVGIPAYSGE